MSKSDWVVSFEGMGGIESREGPARASTALLIFRFLSWVMGP